MYIDISKYQPTVDYSKLQNDGVDGVMIRAVSTNKNGPYIDGYFKTHYDGCKKYNIPVGVYWYTERTNKTEMDTELSLLMSVLNGRTFELPIVIDVESSYIKSIGKTALTDLVVYALEYLEQNSFYTMYYTYKSYLTNLDTPRLRKYDFWLRWYTTTEKPNVGIQYGIHQYTSTGKISAINGNVDCNRVYKDYPTIIKNRGLNGFSTTTDYKKPSLYDEIVRQLNIILENVKNIIDFINSQ